MFKPTTRDKDEKDLLLQLEIAYLQRIEKSSLSLHIAEINLTFQSLYNIYQFMRNKIKDAKPIKDKIDEFIKNYNDIMIDYDDKKDNIKYFLKLNDLNREIYSLLKEALKDEF